MSAHQNFGRSFDIVLIEEPDFQGRDFLRIAHTDDFRNTDAVLTQKFAALCVDAERFII